MIKVADKARIEAAKLMKDDGYDPSCLAYTWFIINFMIFKIE